MSGFRNFATPTSSFNQSTNTLNSATDDDDWRNDDDYQQDTDNSNTLQSNLPSAHNNWREQKDSGDDWLLKKRNENKAVPDRPAYFTPQQYQQQPQTYQPPVAEPAQPPQPPRPSVAQRAQQLGDTANRPFPKPQPPTPARPAPAAPAQAAAHNPFAAPPPPKPVRHDTPSLPTRPAQPTNPLPTTIPAYVDRITATYPTPTHTPAPAAEYNSQPSLFGNTNNMGINTQALSVKYPYFTASEIQAFHQQFASADKDGNDAIHQSDLSSLSTKAGCSASEVTDKLNALSLLDSTASVTFEAFLKAVSKVREEKGVPKPKGQSDTGGPKKIVLHGHLENTTHTINEDEKESFTGHINWVLSGDKDVGHRLPIDEKSMQVFAECKDGLILAKLINDAVPNTIDDRVLNTSKKLNAFQMTENNNLVVNSAKAIGCSVVNIGSQDIIEGREHLILGLIWQIIKIGLQAKIDIKVHPELFRLLEQGETMEDFLKLPPEQILLRWFNYHLKKAGWNKKVSNFSSDVREGDNYTVLLNQLAPNLCSRSPLQIGDLHERAEQVLQNADRLGCRKYLTPKTLVGGNPKLNFAFVANLFNTHPGLEKLTEAELAQLDEWLFSSEGDREARAFALWLNSLGVEPFVNNLFDDLQDGLVLLQAIDRVKPGLVEWKKVNKAPVSSKFKKVENTNYVVVLGKSLKFSLVGIQGSDITDGNKTLTLGLVWQLMREHVIQTLRSLSSAGHDITDADMIKWANETVKRGGKSSSMSNFKDSGLSTGVFFLDLLNGIKSGTVDYGLVTSGTDGTLVVVVYFFGGGDDSAKLNAKYAISIARKLGATIFVLPEDIVEVKPKMVSFSCGVGVVGNGCVGIGGWGNWSL
ncbi:hypothetical protein HDV00_012490 [Rhizophlyctis rosea]|nr:hypothetical protein HDV00_012490 [Rhizophlyctis rosea]